jgi:hypothetical protein
MNNLLIINQETYEILLEKSLNKNPIYNSKDTHSHSNVIELLKDLDSINSASEHYVMKLEGGRNVLYRKSRESKLGLIIYFDKNLMKRNSLIDLSKVYIQNIDKKYASEISKLQRSNLVFHTKEMTVAAIEDLTIKYIENLRKNKLYAKFIYYNFNPNVISSISYKKSKLESTSVILYNSNKDYDKM